MSIPPRYLDELRNRLTLSDIIGRRIKVTRAGREFKACCPFHHEKTPSFTINDDKQFYHCFGCGAHGDVIGFVMQHDNVSFPDAVETLSADAGLVMPKPDPKMLEKAEQAKDLYSLLEDTTVYFEEMLHKDSTGRDVLAYMQGRGISLETMQGFRVGYAPNDYQGLRSYLKDKGYKDAQMIEAGVVKASNKGKEPYVFFRERVMFPVTDRRGRVVAYGGRALPDHMQAPSHGDYTPAKYMNSSETPIFDKGTMLYGEAIARQAVRDDQHVIVTEGYMDVIACHQAGFKGAVAPMGTALTEEQIVSLWSMYVSDEKVPILCFDGDNAGRRAASRAVERILPLLKPGQSARLAFLPDGDDPDSLIKGRGAPAFKAVLDSALSLFDFVWNSHMAGRNFETPEARAGVTKALEKHIAEIADKDVQSHYKQILRTRISETFFPRREFGGRKGGNSNKRASAPSLKIRRPVRNQSAMQARILSAALVNYPYIYDLVEEAFGRLEMPSPRYAAFKHCIIEALEEDGTLDAAGLRAHLKDRGFEQETRDILNESVYLHADFASPSYTPSDDEPVSIEQKWLELWRSMEQSSLQGEIKQGWKDAFAHSNENDEEKLRLMMQIEGGDTH